MTDSITIAEASDLIEQWYKELMETYSRERDRIDYEIEMDALRQFLKEVRKI